LRTGYDALPQSYSAHLQRPPGAGCLPSDRTRSRLMLRDRWVASVRRPLSGHALTKGSGWSGEPGGSAPDRAHCAGRAGRCRLEAKPCTFPTHTHRCALGVPHFIRLTPSRRRRLRRARNAALVARFFTTQAQTQLTHAPRAAWSARANRFAHGTHGNQGAALSEVHGYAGCGPKSL